MITIGEQRLAIRTLDDLDARLVAATGCNSAEHRAMLAGSPHAIHLARALHPFLKDDVPVQELAVMIAGADVPAIIGEVRALYAEKTEVQDGGD